MIEQFGGNDDKDPSSATFEFVHTRMHASTAFDRRLVVGLLQQEGEGKLGQAFLTLVEGLKDTRKHYSFAELRERDRKAAERESTYLPTEVAARRHMLRREDEGIPNALELFFLTMLSSREWTELCTTEEESALTLGELTTRNVIEAVLSDEPRTKKFIRGVQAEMQKLRDSSATVYDVGCGPFPILGLSAALASREAKVTCIELNPLSAKIAQAIVKKFEDDGSLAPGQVIIKVGDALSVELPPAGSIDLFISETLGSGLLDEKGPKIFEHYAECVNAERGSTIPYRTKLSAALAPTNQGVSWAEDGTEIVRYPTFVINANGVELPVIPSHEWAPLEGGKEIPLTNIPKMIEGVLDLPPGISADSFSGNYGVAVSADFIVNRGGQEIASRYETFISSPVVLGMGFIDVPEDLKGADPASLQVKFSFMPGSASRTGPGVEVVRKGAV